MEPKLPVLNSGPEYAPTNYSQGFEQVPALPNPEVGLETSVERVEQRSEATPAAVNAMPTLPPIQVTAAPAVSVDDSVATPVVDDTPIAANDDDLIEKEWVDKAKKIILQTKDDPYRREQEVSKLQADYLRKRYGKELGAAE
jgi:hypothetical protein